MKTYPERQKPLCVVPVDPGKLKVLDPYQKTYIYPPTGQVFSLGVPPDQCTWVKPALPEEPVASMPEGADVDKPDSFAAAEKPADILPTHVVDGEYVVATVSEKNQKTYYNRVVNGKKGPMVGIGGKEVLPFDEDVERQVAEYDPDKVPDDVEAITREELRRHLLKTMGILG